MPSNSHLFPELPPLDGRGEEDSSNTTRRPWPPSPATVESGGYVPGRTANPWAQSQSTPTPDFGQNGQSSYSGQYSGPGSASPVPPSGATGSWAAISALMPRLEQSGALETADDDEPPPDDDPWASDAEFVAACQAEYDRISTEIRELRLLVRQASKDLEQFKHRKVLAAAHVREIEERLETHPRQEIRSAYLEASESEMRAFMMGEQRDQLRSKLRTYGQYARFLQRAITMLQPPAFERSTLLPPGAPIWAPPAVPASTSPLPPYSTPPAALISWPVLPDVPPAPRRPDTQPQHAPAAHTAWGDNPPDTTAETAAIVARIVQAQESVRQRVAQRLHEGPAQSLANVLLAAEICERLVGSDPRRAVGELANLKGRVNATLRETRGFIDELLPPTLAELGLVATLRRYAADMAVRYQVEVPANLPPTEPRMKQDREIALFRVAQEAILNAVEHGRARNVAVTLQVARDAVGLTVEDNGTGFDVEQKLAEARNQHTTGLAGMQQRADLLGGWLKIESLVGSGTRVELAAPR